jgi:hypothetical protein
VHTARRRRDPRASSRGVQPLTQRGRPLVHQTESVSIGVVSRLDARRRRRELGAGSRSGRHARRLAWERQRAFLRRCWPVTLGIFVLTPALMLPAALLQHGSTRAAIIGASVATGFWLAIGLTTLVGGVGPTMMGAVAERWTASELRRLRRSGWRLINGLKLRPVADVDHIAVWPGGLLIVETKWAAEPWPLAVEGMAFMANRLKDAADQARRNCRDVRAHFKQELAGTPVRTVLVLWSPSEISDASEWIDVESVALVQGGSFGRWLKRLPTSDDLAAGDIERVWAALDRQVEIRDSRDAAMQASPAPTVLQALWRWVVQPYLGAFVATYAFSTLVLTHDWRVEALGNGVALVLGLAALRIRPIRRFAIGWVAVSWVLAALFAVVLVGS